MANLPEHGHCDCCGRQRAAPSPPVATVQSLLTFSTFLAPWQSTLGEERVGQRYQDGRDKAASAALVVTTVCH